MPGVNWTILHVCCRQAIRQLLLFAFFDSTNCSKLLVQIVEVDKIKPPRYFGLLHTKSGVFAPV